MWPSTVYFLEKWRQIEAKIWKTSTSAFFGHTKEGTLRNFDTFFKEIFCSKGVFKIRIYVVYSSWVWRESCTVCKLVCSSSNYVNYATRQTLVFALSFVSLACGSFWISHCANVQQKLRHKTSSLRRSTCFKEHVPMPEYGLVRARLPSRREVFGKTLPFP